MIVSLSARAEEIRTAPRAAAPKTYARGEVQLESSRVYVYVGKSGLGHVHGVAGTLKSGSVDFAKSRDCGQLVFDMKSFVADPDYARKYLGIEGEVSDSSKKQVTENMLGPEVLDAKQYPVATYHIRTVTPSLQEGAGESQRVKFAGDLTLHGVTRPVEFEADVESKGGWRRVRGAFALRQSDYGITPLKKAFGAIGVADELKISGDLWVAAAATRP